MTYRFWTRLTPHRRMQFCILFLLIFSLTPLKTEFFISGFWISLRWMGLYTSETRFYNISTIQSELVCLLLIRFMVRTFIKRILDPWCQNKCFGIYIVIHMFQMHKIQKGEIQQKVNKMLNIVDQKYLKILLCSKSYPKKSQILAIHQYTYIGDEVNSQSTWFYCIDKHLNLSKCVHSCLKTPQIAYF